MSLRQKAAEFRRAAEKPPHRKRQWVKSHRVRCHNCNRKYWTLKGPEQGSECDWCGAFNDGSNYKPGESKYSSYDKFLKEPDDE